MIEIENSENKSEITRYINVKHIVTNLPKKLDNFLENRVLDIIYFLLFFVIV